MLITEYTDYFISDLCGRMYEFIKMSFVNHPTHTCLEQNPNNPGKNSFGIIYLIKLL